MISRRRGWGFAVWVAVGSGCAGTTPAAFYGDSDDLAAGGGGRNDLAHGTGDLATRPGADLAGTTGGQDLATSAPGDLAMARPDMAVEPPDMTVLVDMVVIRDLAVRPPDLAVSCMDGIHNGAETDVDCGGGTCGACANGKACSVDGDCVSKLCVAQKCAPTPVFMNSNIAVGKGPWGVAVWDWNGDGNDDVAVTNTVSNTVSVLLGKGNGTFQAAVSYATGTTPNVLTFDDFNGDGIADLVCANATSNNVSVLLGNVNGTFKAAVNTAVGLDPEYVNVFDFNADGREDIVVSNLGGNTVQTLKGNGNGTFTSVSTFGVASPFGIATGDYNQDGRHDFIVTQSMGMTVQVMLNPNFLANNYATGSSPTVIVYGDTNGDKIADMVVSNFASNDLSVLLGNGKNGVADGTFKAAASYAAGMSPQFITGTDYNGDGHLDLAVANVNSANVSVILGNGDGTFRAPINLGVGRAPRAIETADFNGDGKWDLVVANQNDNTITVLLNTTP